MSSIRINAPSMDFTPIDNVFIDKYMADARGDFIKIYIGLLRFAFSKVNVDIKEIASSLNILETDIQKGLEYWENQGLLRISPEGTIDILQIDPDKSIKQEVYFDNSIKDMFNDIERLIGRPLSSKELTVYISLIEDYGFSPEVINLLIEYCMSRRKTDIRYIEKVAIAWHEAGIKNLEDAQNHITKHEEKWINYRVILNYMGFKDMEIPKPQEDMLEKWLFKYKFSVEIIQEACKISVMRINECNFSYIDAILEDWNKKGIDSLDKIKQTTKNFKQSKKSKDTVNQSNGYLSKYNMKELKEQLLGRSIANEE